jgi:hypothetical protein
MSFGIPSRRKNPDGSPYVPNPDTIKFFACRKAGCVGKQAYVEILAKGVVRFCCTVCGNNYTVGTGGGG